jgi:aminoglycoside phosphotransferase (APT) family kinase protein
VLPLLAPLLPVEVPLPLAEGAPGEGYPWPWAVYRWLDGRNPTLQATGNADALVQDATAFLRALRRVDPTGGPAGVRGSLARRDEAVRRGLAALRRTLEVEDAAAACRATCCSRGGCCREKCAARSATSSASTRDLDARARLAEVA